MEIMKDVGNIGLGIGLGIHNMNIIPSCKCHLNWIITVGDKNRDEENSGCSKICMGKDNKEQENQCSREESIEWKTLSQSVLQSNIVEIYLDCVFSENNNFLSPELFKCVNVRVLSLRKNNLVYLSPEIGRLSKLKTLILTENFLTNRSIPYTLTFCKYLQVLYLDYNFLDALPGFLLEMPYLETVYRHGNDNYFKSTFLWFHSSKQDRVLPLIFNGPRNERALHQPKSLQLHAITSLIASKINFFKPGLLPVTLQEKISRTYLKFIICAFCGEVFCPDRGGYKVFTFKSPYLGNTCVPFQHWACSRQCGVALVTPARQQERDQAFEADRQYQQYIASVQRDLCLVPRDTNRAKSSCTLL